MIKTKANILKLSAVAAASLTLGAISASAAISVTWDFISDDLQGWTVTNGEANFEGDGVNAGYTDATPTSGLYAHDGAHVSFVLTSPGIINFSGANALDPLVIINQVGGTGAQGGSIASPANRSDLLGNNGGNSAVDGLKGVAFRNLTTGNYDYIDYKPDDGNPAPDSILDLTTLLAGGVNQTDNYELDYFDNDEGGWGWTRLNSVALDETVVVPEPSAVGLFGIAGLALILLRRRSRR